MPFLIALLLSVVATGNPGDDPPVAAVEDGHVYWVVPYEIVLAAVSRIEEAPMHHASIEVNGAFVYLHVENADMRFAYPCRVDDRGMVFLLREGISHTCMRDGCVECGFLEKESGEIVGCMCQGDGSCNHRISTPQDELVDMLHSWQEERSTH
jgi:hypothetical protein